MLCGDLGPQKESLKQVLNFVGTFGYFILNVALDLLKRKV